MKKCLLFVIIFLTGCSVNYNLTIDDNNILEDVNINVSDDISSSDIDSQISHKRYVYDGKKDVYDVKYKNNLINYNFKHDIDDYSKSNFLKKCYSSYNFENNSDFIVIDTDSRFNCIDMEDDFYADEVLINIKTDLQVISNNADRVRDNVYTWVIDGSNYNNKPISMKIKKSFSNRLFSNVFLIIIIVILLLVSALVAFRFYFKKKDESVNKF